MNPQASSILWEAATVGAIVVATRWLLGTQPGESFKTLQNYHIYGIRNRVRFAGFGVAGLFIVFTFVFRRDLSQSGDRWLVTFQIVFIFPGNLARHRLRDYEQSRHNKENPLGVANHWVGRHFRGLLLRATKVHRRCVLRVKRLASTFDLWL